MEFPKLTLSCKVNVGTVSVTFVNKLIVLAELLPFCNTVSRLTACDTVSNLILFVVGLSIIVIPEPCSRVIFPFNLSKVVTTP